jgi:hypothetical protein
MQNGGTEGAPRGKNIINTYRRPGPSIKRLFIFKFLLGFSRQNFIGDFQYKFIGDFPVNFFPLFSGPWAWVGFHARTACSSLTETRLKIN